MAAVITRMSFLEYNDQWECVVQSKDFTADEVHSMAPEVIKNYDKMLRFGATLPHGLESVLISLCQFMIALFPKVEMQQIIHCEKQLGAMHTDDVDRAQEQNLEQIRTLLDRVPQESLLMFLTAVKVMCVMTSLKEDQDTGSRVACSDDVMRDMDNAQKRKYLMKYMMRYMTCEIPREETDVLLTISEEILRRTQV